MKGKKVVCPECEGRGKAVNYFDLLNDPHKLMAEKHKTDMKPRRSDGREYLDSECRVCGGNKYIIQPL